MDRVDYLMGDEIYTIGICGAYVVTELMMEVWDFKGKVTAFRGQDQRISGEE
jgi:hypothetical protein